MGWVQFINHAYWGSSAATDGWSQLGQDQESKLSAMFLHRGMKTLSKTTDTIAVVE